jgi:imidazoleglycerol phosphate dehydratase HisB
MVRNFGKRRSRVDEHHTIEDTTIASGEVLQSVRK